MAKSEWVLSSWSGGHNTILGVLTIVALPTLNSVLSCDPHCPLCRLLGLLLCIFLNYVTLLPVTFHLFPSRSLLGCLGPGNEEAGTLPSGASLGKGGDVGQAVTFAIVCNVFDCIVLADGRIKEGDSMEMTCVQVHECEECIAHVHSHPPLAGLCTSVMHWTCGRYKRFLGIILILLVGVTQWLQDSASSQMWPHCNYRNEAVTGGAAAERAGIERVWNWWLLWRLGALLTSSPLHPISPCRRSRTTEGGKGEVAESSPLLGLRPLRLLQPPSPAPTRYVCPTCPVEPSTGRGCPLCPAEARQAQGRGICTEEEP